MIIAQWKRGVPHVERWTDQECGLLANLCAELGVDAPEHAELVKRGEALAAPKPRR